LLTQNRASPTVHGALLVLRAGPWAMPFARASTLRSRPNRCAVSLEGLAALDPGFAAPSCYMNNAAAADAPLGPRGALIEDCCIGRRLRERIHR